ncbi:hypothetical protein J6590_009617 [Homalodisca vitripennis]|nr:hypothetical protein J6590_009617 [Homalodisca vitripennis]
MPLQFDGAPFLPQSLHTFSSEALHHEPRQLTLVAHGEVLAEGCETLSADPVEVDYASSVYHSQLLNESIYQCGLQGNGISRIQVVVVWESCDDHLGVGGSSHDLLL